MQVHEISISALEALASRDASDCNKTGHGLCDMRDRIHGGEWLVVMLSTSFDFGVWFDVLVRKDFDSLEMASAWASGREEANAYCLSTGQTIIYDEYEVWHVVDDAPASDVVRQDHVVAHDSDNVAQGEKPRIYSVVSCRRCLGFLDPDNFCYQGCDWYYDEIEESLRQLRDAGAVA